MPIIVAIEGMVVVATSNRPPKDLYLHGLQRESFLPFIDEVYDHLEVHNVDAGVDYRLGGSDGGQSTYFIEGEHPKMEYLWQQLTKGAEHVAPTNLVVEGQGRSVAIPLACLPSRVARFTFADLCDNPLGSADYLAISVAFHTVFITDVPLLDKETLPQTRRLISLVDALYESRVKTVITAAKLPTELFDRSGIASAKDEAFAFDRTASRLIEMQSVEYRHSQHGVLLGSSEHEDPAPEPFLLRFESQRLSDDAILSIWDEFDVDNSNTLDRKELALMLGSLSFIRNGHHSVPQELLESTWLKLDTDGDGNVSFDEFQSYMREYGLAVDFVPAAG